MVWVCYYLVASQVDWCCVLRVWCLFWFGLLKFDCVILCWMGYVARWWGLLWGVTFSASVLLFGFAVVV